ncbi:MAG TPA: hypothetical protein VKM94_23475 [Blastocatellia bacterium]|nr:hypothetical protein [Blastocatellia bacterium]
MQTLSRLAISFLLIFSVLRAAVAQEGGLRAVQHPDVTVTSSALGGRVRFTAPSSVVQIRLEIYNSAGRKLFDNEVRGGNVLDWHLQDGQAQALTDDSYLCAVTVKSVSGKLTQRIGTVKVEKSSATVQPVDAAQLTAQQAQAIGPLEEDASLTVMKEDDNQTATVIAHNGEEGQITRGKGALSFRVGDFFSGKDSEQMRLTAEGNLGIGESNPQAKLDVAGRIRSSEGIIFPDGSIQLSAARKTLGAPSLKPGQSGKPGQENFEPQTSGTGTQDKLAKWTDNAGTLGNSIVSDTGFLTIDSSSNPQPPGFGTLIIEGSANKERIELRSAGAVPGPALQGKGFGGTIGVPTATLANSDLFIIGGSGHNGSGLVPFNAGTIKIKAEQNWTPSANGSYINFETTPSGLPTAARTERMRITGAGDVGIGTINPLQKLHLDGLNSRLRLHSTQSDLWTVTEYATDAREWHTGVGGSTVFNDLNNKYYIGDFTAGQVRMVVDPNGRVGIGTTSPGAKLMVDASEPFGIWGRNSGTLGIGVFGSSTKYKGVYGVADLDDGVFGTSNKNGMHGRTASGGDSGVWGENTGSGFGVAGSSVNGIGVIGDTTNGFAMQARGNTVQDRDKGGWVKAMAYVDGLVGPGDGIIRCYNSQASGSNVSTAPCGLTYTRAGVGHYVIDFGFPVNDRFIHITPVTVLSTCVMSMRIDPNSVTANQVRVHSTCADTGNDTNSSFYISVF